jgi:hypothetical protein
MQEGCSNTEATSYGDHTDPLLDPSTLILSTAAPRSCTNQSTEHKNTQMPNPSTDTTILNTETTKQGTGPSPLDL